MTKEESMKSFNLRITKSTWTYLKKESMDKEVSMTQIILGLIEKHKKEQEKG